MNNEKLRIQALRGYALNSVAEAEEKMKDGDLVGYASAAGLLTGVLKAVATDAKFWLEELGDAERLAHLPDLERVLDPRD